MWRNIAHERVFSDMDDTDLAAAVSTISSYPLTLVYTRLHQLALPVGLVNLGNTCYMNATLQAMRAIPELQTALERSV